MTIYSTKSARDVASGFTEHHAQTLQGTNPRAPVRVPKPASDGAKTVDQQQRVSLSFLIRLQNSNDSIHQMPFFDVYLAL